MSIDTKKDFKVISSLLKETNNEVYNWEKILRIMIDNYYE